MLEQIFQQQQPLCSTLIEIHFMPIDTEIYNMEAFIEAVRLIVEITEVIGKEKRVSLSAVWLFLYE